MLRWLRLSIVLLLSGLYCHVAMAQEAVRWLPADCNAVLVVDVTAAYKSPLAVQNQWVKKAAESFLAQEVLLPPTAKRVTIGAQLDFGNVLTPVRENIVLELKPGTELANVTAITGGEVEKVGERAGLSIDDSRFVIEAAPQLWLMAQPGGRQATSRWARTGINADAPMSQFLRSAAAQVSEENPIVIAIDLAETVSLSAAREVLQDLPGTPLKGAALDAAAKVLVGTQGLVAKIHLGTTRQAQIRIEFSQSAMPLGPVAMPLVQTVLQQWGASLEDSNAWKAKVDGYALVFDGELSATGLKRVISVIHPSFIPAQGADPAASQKSATIVASQKYIRSVRHELDSLQATMKRTRDNHALWFERAAKAIDGLPLKNVDPDLQIYGSRVSASLRYQSQAERMSNIRAGTREAQTKANTFYSGFGPYGEFYSNASYGNTPAIRAEENEGSRNVRFTEMKQIEDGMVEIRRKLTNKYNEEF